MGRSPGITVGHISARPKLSRGEREGRLYWEARWPDTDAPSGRAGKALGWLTRTEAEIACARLLTDGTQTKPAQPERGRWRISDLVAAYMAHVDGERQARAKLERAGAEKRRRERLGGISEGRHRLLEHQLGVIERSRGDLPCSRLSSTLLEDLHRDLQRPGVATPDGYAPLTSRYIVSTLHAAWRWAWEREYLPADPRPVMPRRLPGGTLLPRIEPDAEQIQALVARAEGWRRAWLAIAAGSGMRPGEIASLVRGDVDVEARRIRLRHTPGRTKTGARVVALPAWVVAELAPVLGVAPDASLWPFVEPATSMRTWLHAATAGGPLEGMRLYGLRHACATALRSSGAPNAMSAAQLGHTERMFELQYGSTPAEDIAAWVDVAAPGAPAREGRVVQLRGHTRGTGRRGGRS